MAEIGEFLRTGRLGPITVGLSRDAVRDLLGEPEETSGSRNPEIWKYGSLQLGFYRGPGSPESVLTSINLFFHDPGASIPERLEMIGWMPTGASPVEAFRDYIPGYDPQIYADAPSFGEIAVALDSGVRIIFDEGRLYGIHYQAKREPEGKQLTLFIPKDVLEVLKKEAANLRISVPALCARWLQERAAEFRGVGIR